MGKDCDVSHNERKKGSPSIFLVSVVNIYIVMIMEIPLTGF